MTFTTNEQIVAEYYIAAFGRTPDLDGLNYWVGQYESNAMTLDQIRDTFTMDQSIAEVAARFPANASTEDFVTSIYVNVLGRQPDAGGLAYWVGRVDSDGEDAIDRNELLTNMLDAAKGAENDSATLSNKLAAAEYFLTETPNANPVSVDSVNSDSLSLASLKLQIDSLGDSNIDTSEQSNYADQQIFTLKQATVSTEAEFGELLWGTPEFDAAGNITNYDEMITSESLLTFLTGATGTDLSKLGLIDDNGVSLVDSVNSVTTADGAGASISLTNQNGDVIATEAELGQDYIDFIENLLFARPGANASDEADASGEADVNGYDGDNDVQLASRFMQDFTAATTSNTNTILTTAVNNGGTWEQGFTSHDKDDIIVVGTLELLDQAYIDAGNGQNSLEVSAKGVYAQPLQLLNIQDVMIQNLPNVYDYTNTTDTTSSDYIGNGTDAPGDTNGSNNSVLDLTNARNIETLAITEGNETGTALGELTVVGVRNNAELTLVGEFTQDVNIDYAWAVSDALDVTFNVGDVDAALDIGHNNGTLNITSAGSYNTFTNIANDFGGSVQHMNISGAGEFNVMYDLGTAGSFNAGHPIYVDASANTAGVDMTITHNDEVQFVATNADDHINVVAGKSVAVISGAGNDEINVDGSNMANVNAGEGNNEISATTITMNSTITAGNGNNTITTDAPVVSVTTGTGNDTITAAGNSVTVTTAGGTNTINVTDAGVAADVYATMTLVVDAGTSASTVVLGTDDEAGTENGAILNNASSITGTDVTLSVMADSDISQAVDIAGVTAVAIDENNTITVTVDQFVALGAAAFSAQEDYFGKINGGNADVNILITEDLNFNDLGDMSAFDCDNIDLTFTFACDDTLTLSAAQLDMYVGLNGIDVSTAGNFNGNVVLTDAANDFDWTVAAGKGSIVDANINVFVQRTDDGYSRPVVDAQQDYITVETTEDLTLETLDANINGIVFATEGATLTLTATQVAGLLDSTDLLDGNAGDGVANNFMLAAGVTTATLNIVDYDAENLELDLIAAAGITIGTVTLEDDNGAMNITANTTTSFGGADIVTPTVSAGEGAEGTVVTMTLAQLASTSGNITGDSQVNLTGLRNNVDADGNYTLEGAEYDLSAINNAGTLTFANASGTAQTVTLTDTANLGGFEIVLGDEHMIQFATEAQASGTTVSEAAGGDITAVAWLFETITSAIDTTNYDVNMETLYVNDVLVAGQNVESLYNTLSSATAIEVMPTDAMPVLLGFNRTVIVEAATNAGDLTFDDQDEYQTTLNLTVNMEGNAVVGNVVIDDTVGAGEFNALTINSYEDLSTTNIFAGGTATLLPNTMGNIGLSATPSNELVNVTIDTHGTGAAQFSDGANVATGVAVGRDGLAIEVGTITFASTSGDNTTANLTLDGANDITIEAVAFGSNVTLIQAANATTAPADVEIAGINHNNDNIDFVNGHVETATVAHNFGTVAGTNDTLVVVGGDNDLTLATTFNTEAITVTGDATLTLTAAQASSISMADANNDGIPDALSVLNGANVVLNITALTTEAVDLDEWEDAGFDIGTVTIADAGATLSPATTFGNADSVVIEVDASNTAVEMTAAQYKTLLDGTITENLSAGAVTADFKASVNVTQVDEIATTQKDAKGLDQEVANIDFTNVAVTGSQVIYLDGSTTGTAGTADITFDNASILNGFAVELFEQDAAANLLGGQTVRFSNALQAERAVIATNDVGGNGSNVVWLFTTISGTANGTQVDTSDYDGAIDRVWMLEDLVDGANIEELFTTLNENIIVRVVTEDELLSLTNPYDRHVEVEAFVSLATGLTFNDIDGATAPFDFVENLTIDLGGATNVGDIAVDNIIAASVNNDDEFDTLTVNSILADTNTHYLLPEHFDTALNPRPDELTDAADQANNVGDISSGASRDVLLNVAINTSTAVGGNTGAALNVGTITFADDGEETGDDTATLAIAGTDAVTIAAVNTDDTDVVNLVITNADAAAVTITGASPAAALSNTESLSITSTHAASSVTLGTAGDADKPGIYGPDLSTVILIGAGDFDLGVIADIDGSTPVAPATTSFTMNATATTGTVDFTLGGGATAGSPELDADGVWTFNFNASDLAADKVTMTIADDVVFNAGGTLNIDEVDELIIDSNVDLSVLGTDLNITNTTINVAAGQTLTLTAEQANGMDINGAGTVEILNLEETPLANLSGIMTSVAAASVNAVDDSGVVNAYVNTADSDADGNPEAITLGNVGVAHVTVTGDGSITAVTTMAPVDRSTASNDMADATVPSFTINDTATINFTAAQMGILNKPTVDATDWKVLVDGTGTVNVPDITDNSKADLSGITATGAINATVAASDAEFTGDLGTATVSINAGITLTAQGSVLDGLTIIDTVTDPATAGSGTISIADNAGTTAQDMDLSNVTATTITFAAATVLGTVTFPALRDGDLTATPPTSTQTVAMTSVQADGQTITGAADGADADDLVGGVVNIDVDETSADAFDLSAITSGTTTVTFESDYTLHANTDLGAATTTSAVKTVNIDTTAGNTTVTMTGAQADGLTMNESAGANTATLELTSLAGGEDLTGITVDAITAIVTGGTVDLSAVTGLTAIDVASSSAADLTLGAEQFTALEAGVSADLDIAELNSLTVDVTYTIGTDDFAADLTVVRNGVTDYTVSGASYGISQSMTDDGGNTGSTGGADGDFTDLILENATIINHNSMGSVVSADAGAIGFATIQDNFIFSTTSAYSTAITTFSGNAGDGDKLDLSAFGDADSSADDVADAVSTTIADNAVYFVDGSGTANSADTIADSANVILAQATAIDDQANTNEAYFVVVDDNSTSIYHYVNDGVDDSDIQDAELTLMGTINAQLVITDIIA